MSTSTLSQLRTKARGLGRWDYLILLCVSLVLLDGLMTLPHWQLEGNPVVLALGPVGMMLAKLSGVSGLLFVWFSLDGVRNSLITKTSVTMLTLLYAVVVFSNVGVLILR